MADIADLEQRVSALEQQVASLKDKPPIASAAANWLEQVAGSMKDYPEFDEVVALGKAARQADRPADAANDVA
jgi:hypothetical protein